MKVANEDDGLKKAKCPNVRHNTHPSPTDAFQSSGESTACLAIGSRWNSFDASIPNFFAILKICCTKRMPCSHSLDLSEKFALFDKWVALSWFWFLTSASLLQMASLLPSASFFFFDSFGMCEGVFVWHGK